jgi:hypothetical protein
MNVSSESVPRKGLLSEKASSLPSAQRSYIPDRGLLSSVVGIGTVVVSREFGVCSWYPGNRKGTWSSPVTRVAAVMMAAELL